MISVLYVDDDPALLEMGKMFLESTEDLEVTPFLSAHAALRELSSRSFDVVLSDYQMPEMDGIELLKEIRRLHGDIPFILFTGKGREEIVIQAINNGADFYVQKGGEATSQFAELIHHILAAVERHDALNQLRDSEQRLKDIIDFSPNPTFAIDTEGRVIIWNKAIEDLSGIPAEKMLGRGNYEYALPFYGERRPVLIDQIREPETVMKCYRYTLIKNERTILIADSIVLPGSDGPKYYQGRVSRLYNKDGKNIGVIESLTDITELKLSEEKLKAAYERQMTILEALRRIATRSKKRRRTIPSKSDTPQQTTLVFSPVS